MSIYSTNVINLLFKLLAKFVGMHIKINELKLTSILLGTYAYIADKCSRNAIISQIQLETIWWSLYGLTMKLDIYFANEPCIHIAFI